ncbi:MAG: two-component system sensor histidine kinase KdbD, partial [Cyanobacteria bacterium SZAS TMP-1]|nr:two-component system sensor histidine kinase KdbD [Cyanobacteria bacterium SZAS TMP-1]
MTEVRRDPEALLSRLKHEEESNKRGRLKVFFGAVAGVGKTYAMLLAARKLKEQKVDVVIGYIETHGRPETEALLEGLEIIPVKLIEYKGTTLKELDIDAARARKPEVILVDELAHTNAPGSRHAKRWQDVQELMEAGIDVLTTLNVQHVESLYDVVAQITKVG